MKDLREINRKRKSIRKWMLIAAIPAMLAVALYGVKVISMNEFASSSSASYVNGDMTAAQQSAGRLKFANWFETWKASFNNGTTLIALGSYDLAVPELKTALSDFEQGKDIKDKKVKEISCEIRGNLAIAYEGFGDNQITDKEFDKAQSSYDEAKAVIKDCDDESSNGTKERLDEKEKATEGDEQPKEDEPTKEEVEEIQDQLDKNNEDRQDEESSEDNGEVEGGGGDSTSEPVDKPW